jgi:hypothetical protein
MNKGLKFYSILTLLIFIAQNISANISLADEWKPTKHSYPDQPYVFNTVSQFIEYSNGISIGSKLTYNKPTSGGGTVSVYCESFESENCGNALPTQRQADLTFPLCNETLSTWCIRKVFIYKKDTQPVEAEFIKYVDGNKFSADKKFGLPEGGTISLWKMKESNSIDQTVFAIDVNQSIRWTPNPYYYQLTAGIYPIELINGAEYFPELFTKNEFSSTGSSYKISPKCENAVFTSLGECGTKVKFPENLKFGLSIVVPQNVNGFISGRLESPEFSTNIDEGDSTNKVISVLASPLKIPRLGVALTKEQALQMIPSLGDSGMNWFAQDNRQDGDILKRIDFLRKIVGDKASGFSTVWNFTNLGSAGSAINSCSIPKDSFPGLISTNAMILSPNPPVFKDSEFTYQVAGMHFEPDGKTLTVGNYTMIISKYLVSCLYGSNLIPITASVSIINSETGDKKVSVSTVIRDRDYYKLNIAGFNFSNPEIRIKLQFPEIKAPLKRTSIVCLKGKSKKQISGLNPKCPTGFKISK